MRVLVLRGNLLHTLAGRFAMPAALAGLTGCSVWWQTPNTVLVREPTSSGYHPERPAATAASDHVPYAVLSANVYERAHAPPQNQSTLLDLMRVPCQEVAWPVRMDGWQRWTSFPDEQLKEILHKGNMHVEVWEELTESPRIVIAFEGTVFESFFHWRANLRWLMRFLPKYEDHYTVASREISAAFHRVISESPQRYRYDPQSATLRLPDGRPVQIITTGHSLGGGLAQQFAYAFAQASDPPAGPKVKEVFAFDSSPVTGWFSTPNPPRDYNASGLRINRIFEHGEILAYLRIVTSNLAMRSENPEMWIYRYNFEQNPNLIAGHSMKELACGIARAAVK